MLACLKHGIVLLLWFSSPSFIDICCWSNMSYCWWCTDCWWTVLFFLCRFPDSTSQILSHRERMVVELKRWKLSWINWSSDRTAPKANLWKLEATILGGKSPVDAAGSHWWWLSWRLQWHVPQTAYSSGWWQNILGRSLQIIMSLMLCIIMELKISYFE